MTVDWTAQAWLDNSLRLKLLFSTLLLATPPPQILILYCCLTGQPLVCCEWDLKLSELLDGVKNKWCLLLFYKKSILACLKSPLGFYFILFFHDWYLSVQFRLELPLLSLPGVTKTPLPFPAILLLPLPLKHRYKSIIPLWAGSALLAYSDNIDNCIPAPQLTLYSQCFPSHREGMNGFLVQSDCVPHLPKMPLMLFFTIVIETERKKGKMAFEIVVLSWSSKLCSFPGEQRSLRTSDLSLPFPQPHISCW